VSDINTALVDRLKALDPNRPIREADIGERHCMSAKCQERLSAPQQHIGTRNLLSTSPKIDTVQQKMFIFSASFLNPDICCNNN